MKATGETGWEKGCAMLLGKLIDGVSGLSVRASAAGHESLRICDVTEDSRTVLPGSLYIARKGETADGNSFIPAALAAGAVAVLSDNPNTILPKDPKHPQAVLLTADNVPLVTSLLAERFYGSPSSKLVVFGVTGTNGKTTTTYLIHQLLNAAHVRTGLVGTVFVDDGTEVAAATMTTPPALELSRTLGRMLEAGCQAAVVEVSSHSLDQNRVAAVSFDAAAFTNLTGDHLDYHKDMETYAAAKSRLFKMLPPHGAAIVNGDDPWSGKIAEGCAAPVREVSLQSDGASGKGKQGITARVVKATRWGTEAVFAGPWGETNVSLPFVGPHNLMNALQAASLVWALAQQRGGKIDLTGRMLDMTSLANTLAHASLPPGRLQCLTSPADSVTVYVDYAHTDDALRTVLTVFRDVVPRPVEGASAANAGRVIVVFGCGGDRDRTKRPRMGAVAAELADRIYVTSDNPRTEEPRSIIDAIVSGMPAEARARTVIEPDREQAIHAAIAEAQAGDVVVIAGKGHEDYQILPGAPDAAKGGRATTVKRFFDDRLVARDALALRGIKAVNPQPTIVVRQPSGHSHVRTNGSAATPRTETT